MIRLPECFSVIRLPECLKDQMKENESIPSSKEQEQAEWGQKPNKLRLKYGPKQMPSIKECSGISKMIQTVMRPVSFIRKV